MALTVRNFTPKPGVIQFVQLTSENLQDVADAMPDNYSASVVSDEIHYTHPMNGPMVATIGSVLTIMNGEPYGTPFSANYLDDYQEVTTANVTYVLE